MKSKFKKALAYVIPTILIFLIINLYLEINTSDNSEDNSLQKNILGNVFSEMDIALKKENYKYKIFKNSLNNFTPFSSVVKNKQISYVQLLKNKCLDSNSVLSEDEKTILKSYSTLIHITNGIYYDNEVFLLKTLGFGVSMLMLVVLFVLCKKIQNRFYRKIAQYYTVLFFLINYGFSSTNSSDLFFLEKSLIECQEISTFEDDVSNYYSNPSTNSTGNSKKEYEVNNIDDNWKRVFVKNMGKIELPPTLEIQDGTYKEFSEGLKKKLGFEVDDLVAQNIGVNGFTKEGKQKYARVMLLTDINNSGDFEDLDFNINQYSEDEVIEIGNYYKKLILQQFENASHMSKSKLVKWDSAKLDKINQMSYLYLKYERQLDNNSIVLVNTYVFYNNDRVHTLVMSYRKDESEYWGKDFQKILKSLEINKSE